MLDAVAHWALAGPKRVLLIAGLLMALCGALGAPVATMLSSGGYTDPNAESNVSARTLVESFGQGAVPLYLLVRSDSALTGPSVRFSLQWSAVGGRRFWNPVRRFHGRGGRAASPLEDAS